LEVTNRQKMAVWKSLFDLTWKDMEWRWGTEEQSAFDLLKERITMTPILTLPDNS